MRASWRTSLAALATAIVTLYAVVQAAWQGEAPTQEQVLLILVGVATVWGFWSSRDDKVSSEKAGVK